MSIPKRRMRPAPLKSTLQPDRSQMETAMMTTQTPTARRGPPARQEKARTGGMKQFISFKIGEEGYAIDIMAVREIKGWTETTPLPNQPELYSRRDEPARHYRAGLRSALPVRHGAYRGFALARHHHRGRQDRMAGLLVDAVSDILTIDSGRFVPCPKPSAAPRRTTFLASFRSTNHGCDPGPRRIAGQGPRRAFRADERGAASGMTSV